MEFDDWEPEAPEAPAPSGLAGALRKPDSFDPVQSGLAGGDKPEPEPPETTTLTRTIPSNPNSLHVLYLQQNPNAADDFDSKFGPGAAAKYLAKPTKPPSDAQKVKLEPPKIDEGHVLGAMTSNKVDLPEHLHSYVQRSEDKSAADKEEAAANSLGKMLATGGEALKGWDHEKELQAAETLKEAWALKLAQSDLMGEGRTIAQRGLRAAEKRLAVAKELNQERKKKFSATVGTEQGRMMMVTVTAYQQDRVDDAVARLEAAKDGAVPNSASMMEAERDLQEQRALLHYLESKSKELRQVAALEDPSTVGEAIRGLVRGALGQVPELVGSAWELAAENSKIIDLKTGEEYQSGPDKVAGSLAKKLKEFGQEVQRRVYKPKFEGGMFDIQNSTDSKYWIAKTLGEGMGTSAGFMLPAVTAGPRVAGIVGMGMGVGEVKNNLEEAFAARGIELDQAKLNNYAFTYGVSIGLLDSASNLFLLRGITDAAKRKAAKTLAGSMAKAIISGKGTEGVTEGLQEALNVMAGEFAVKGGLAPEQIGEYIRRVVEAAVAGGLVGGTYGAVGGARQHLANDARDKAMRQIHEKVVAELKKEAEDVAAVSNPPIASAPSGREAVVAEPAVPIPTPAKPAPRVKVSDAITVLRDRGGLKDPNGELEAMGVPKQWINNETGLDPDTAREILVENGFITEAPDGELALSTIEDYYEIVRRSAGGERVLPVGDEFADQDIRLTQVEYQQEQTAQILNDLSRQLEADGVPYTLSDLEESRVAELVMQEGFDPFDAFERVAIQRYEETGGRGRINAEATGAVAQDTSVPFPLISGGNRGQSGSGSVSANRVDGRLAGEPSGYITPTSISDFGRYLEQGGSLSRKSYRDIAQASGVQESEVSELLEAAEKEGFIKTDRRGRWRRVPGFEDKLANPSDARQAAITKNRWNQVTAARLARGDTIKVSRQRKRQIAEAIEPYRHMIPADVNVSVVDSYRRDAETSDIIVEMSDPFGGPLEGIVLPWSDVSNLRASYIPGKSSVNGVSGTIAIFNLDLMTLPSKLIEGQLWHELLHVYADRLVSGGMFDRLVSHAKLLGVHNVTVQEMGDAAGFATDDAFATPLLLSYVSRYKDYTDPSGKMSPQDYQSFLLNQEAVSHMMELHHHGYYSTEQMVPVLDIINKIESGAFAGQSQGGSSFVWDDKGFFTKKIGETEIGYSVDPKRKLVEISMVETPKGERGKGSARAALDKMVHEADDNGFDMHLTADPMDRQTSKKKLESFYKSLGFKPNKGRNKDYSISSGMVRRARDPNASRVQAAINGFDAEPVTPGLDMSQEARMQRAKEMGFDTDTVLYHGTNREFDHFDLNAKKRTDSGWYGDGVYFAKTPYDAEFYIDDRDGGHIGKFFAKKSNTLDLAYDSADSANFVEWMTKLDNVGLLDEKTKTALTEAKRHTREVDKIDAYIDSGGPQLAANLAYNSGVARPIRLNDYIASHIGEFTKILKSKGYDSVDTGGEVVIFDPSNIRSVNAAFDPARDGSSNLMFALGGEKPGNITLYRGEGQEDPLRRQNRPGEWYTTDLNNARSYASEAGSRGVFQISVTPAELAKLKTGLTDSEFMVPKEMDARRQPVPPPLPPGVSASDLGYYSHAVEVAKGIKQSKGTPAQFLAQMKKAGVKQAEIDATGLEDWLASFEQPKGKSQQVTRDGLVAFLELQRVPVREAVYDGPNLEILQSEEYRSIAAHASRVEDEIYEDARNNPDIRNFRSHPRFSEWQGIRAKQSELESRSEPTTKWSEYSLDPSNPTYRETVLHLPRRGEKLNARRREIEALGQDATAEQRQEWADIMNRLRPDERDIDGIQQQFSGMPDFHNGHFDEPNAISHLRTSIQPDADGRQNFVVNELQSDWGQGLRENGVRDEAKIADLKTRLEAEQAKLKSLEDKFDAMPVGEKFEPKEYSEFDQQPFFEDAPSGNGLTAKAQDLDFEIDEAKSAVNRITAELWNAEDATSVGHPLVNTTGQWVNTSLRRALRQAVEADADYIAIASGETVDSFGMVAPLEGLQYAYNEMYPKKLRDIIKKLDKDAAKIETLDKLKAFDNSHDRGDGFTRFPLTPKLKAAVMERGQPMFAISGFHASPNDFDRFDAEFANVVGYGSGHRYKSAFFFSTEKNKGKWLELIKHDTGKVHEYEVEVDDANANVVDVSKPLKDQPEAVAVLSKNSEAIAKWPRKWQEKYWNDPGDIASWFYAKHQSSDAAVSELRKRLESDSPNFLDRRGVRERKNITEAINLLEEGTYKKWDNVDDSRSLMEQFENADGQIAGLDEMFQIIKVGDDEFAVTDPSLIKITKKNGESVTPQERTEIIGSIRGVANENFDGAQSVVDDSPWDAARKSLLTRQDSTGRAGNDNVNSKTADVAAFKEFAIREAPGKTLTAQELYEEYTSYVEQFEGKPLALPTFGREFGELGVQKGKIAGRVRYVGIEFIPNAERDANRKLYSEEFLAVQPLWARDVLEKARGFLPARVQVSLVDAITQDGKAFDAAYYPTRKLVEITMDAGPERAIELARHEAVHVSRLMRLFTRREWRILVERANKIGARPDDSYVELYEQQGQAKGHSGARLDAYVSEMLDQEGVAKLAEGWSTGTSYGSRIGNFFDRIKNLLEAMVNGIRGLGFETADEVFSRLETGEIAARDVRESAVNQSSLAIYGDTDIPPMDVRDWHDDTGSVQTWEAKSGLRSRTYRNSNGALSISEEADATWTLQLFDAPDYNALIDLIAAVEEDIGVPIDPGGWLTDEQYEQWSENEPELTRGHHKTGPLFHGMWASQDRIASTIEMLHAAASEATDLGDKVAIAKRASEAQAILNTFPSEIVGSQQTRSIMNRGAFAMGSKNDPNAEAKEIEHSLTDLVRKFDESVFGGRPAGYRASTMGYGQLPAGRKAAATRNGGWLAGVYDKFTGSTRIAIPNDLATMAHEGGHRLEDRSDTADAIRDLKDRHSQDLILPPVPDVQPAQFPPGQTFSGIEIDADTMGALTAYYEANAQRKVLTRRQQAGYPIDSFSHDTLTETAEVNEAVLIRRLGPTTADMVIADVDATGLPPQQMEQYANVRFARSGTPQPRAQIAVDPEQLSEAWGDWFELYILDPEQARNHAPELTAELADTIDGIDPELLMTLEEIQDGYQTLISANPIDAMRSRIKTSANRTTTTEAYERFLELRKRKQAVARKEGKSALRATTDAARTTLGEVLEATSYHIAKMWTDHNEPLKRATEFLIEDHVAKKGMAIPDGHKAQILAIDNPHSIRQLSAHTKQHAISNIMNGFAINGSALGTGVTMQDVLVKAFKGNKASDFSVDNQERFNTYLVVRRLLAEFQRFHNDELPNVPDQLFKESTLEQMRTEMEQADPQFVEAASKLYEYQNNMLRYMYEQGFLSVEQYDEYSQRKDYVPLRRIIDRFGMVKSIKRATGVNKGKVMHRFLGSTLDIVSPLESIIQNVFDFTERAETNHVLNNLMKLLEQAGDNGSQVGRIVPATEMQPYQVEVREAVRKALGEINKNQDELDEFMSDMDAMLGEKSTTTLFKPAAISEFSDRKMVYVFRDGKKHAIELGKWQVAQDIFNLYQSYGPKQSNFLLDAMTLSTQILRAGVTKMPQYIITNLLRDQGGMGVLTSDMTPFKTSIEGLSEVLRNGNMKEAYNRYGGLMGGIDTNIMNLSDQKYDIQAFRSGSFLSVPGRTKARRAFNKILKAPEISEAGSRVGVFKNAYERARSDGLAPKEAMYEAAISADDIMPFGRMGEVMKFMRLAQIFHFANAALQGLSVARRTMAGERNVRGEKWRDDIIDDDGKLIDGTSYRLLDEPAVKAIAMGVKLSDSEKGRMPNSMRILVGMAMMAGVGLLAKQWNSDDEEAEEDVNEYRKATHWGFKFFDKWFWYPKPFELSIPSTYAEYLYDYAVKEDPTAMAKAARSLQYTIVPPHSNSLIDLYYEVSTGESLFGSRPIVSYRTSSRDFIHQKTARTSELGVTIAEFNNALFRNSWAEDILGQNGMSWTRSPEMIDHVIRGMGGTAARDGLALIDIASSMYSDTFPKAGHIPRAEMPIQDMPIVSRLVGAPGKGSHTVSKLWENMNRETGHFMRRSNSYNALVDTTLTDSDNPFLKQEARQYLDAQSEVYRPHMILKAHFKGRSKSRANKLHPLNRAKNIALITGDMRSQLKEGALLIQKTKKIGKERETIVLDPHKRMLLIDTLSRISIREARNAMRLTGVKGWKQKPEIDVKPLMDELKSLSPEVHAEMQSRMYDTGSHKVYSYEAVKKFWPEVSKRLLKNGADADIIGFAIEAKTMRPYAVDVGKSRSDAKVKSLTDEVPAEREVKQIPDNEAEGRLVGRMKEKLEQDRAREILGDEAADRFFELDGKYSDDTITPEEETEYDRLLNQLK